VAAAAELGMFFGLADPADKPIGWQVASVLYGVGDSPLDEMLEAVRVKKDRCEPRVAASLFFQGYAARLLSPQLACIALNGCLPQTPADRLRWRRPDNEVIKLGLTAGGGWEGAAEGLIARLVKDSFDEHLRPLAHALRSRVRMAEAILPDNAASALVNGFFLLREHFGPSWKDLAAYALTQPHLRGSGRMPGTGPILVRRSCCLVYRAPPREKCGDCPLVYRPDGSRKETARIGEGSR
jgi:ferric iron reductase protein FhuF